MTIEAVNKYLSNSPRTTLLRFATAGSVDDGKSTLIGRLLLDTKNIFEDTLSSLESDSKKTGKPIDLAFLTDGLLAEREQKITIDVAYRYFTSPKRKFILADNPGHEQYTRNMATGASTVDAALLLIDASREITAQTRRHAFVLSLMGIKHILVVINKMDAVEYSEESYNRFVFEVKALAQRMSISDLQFVPVSALCGDNIVERSQKMPWYTGPTVLSYLENIYIEGDRNLVDFRFPVQRVSVDKTQKRSLQGQVVSGVVKKGDTLVVLPGEQEVVVKNIFLYQTEFNHAFSGQSVSLSLDRDVDVSRGSLLVHKHNLPHQVDEVEAMIVWLDPKALDLKKSYIFKNAHQEIKGQVTALRYKVNIDTLHKQETDQFSINDIGRITFQAQKTICIDYYRKNKRTGSFILIDPETYKTMAAGMVVDRVPLKSEAVSSNIFVKSGKTFWLTGLSGSGKSSISDQAIGLLKDHGHPFVALDGDHVRNGLCKDLGFSNIDRFENIRRVAEVAKLFNEAGQNVLATFVSPTKDIRDMARSIISSEKFKEIFVDAPVAICEKRDVKGLYKKARRGEVKEFTGISAPFELPLKPDLHLKTDTNDLPASVEQLVNYIITELKGSTKD